jgi:ubiquinone/menaquinone biosynthesis C-methylase UbiE
MPNHDWDQTIALHERRYAAADDTLRYQNLTLTGLRPRERAIVETCFDPSHKTLEVGCGTGRVAFGLERQLGFQDVTGVDIVEGYVREAQGVAAAIQSSVRFEVASVTSLPFRDASFEQIVCTENLVSHLPTFQTREEGFRELLRVLCPGGVLVADAMNAEGMKWYVRIVRMTMRLVRLFGNRYGYAANSLPRLRLRGRCPDFLFFLPNRPTVHYFTPGELVFDLLACGFHVAAMRGCGADPGRLESWNVQRRNQGLYVVCQKPHAQVLQLGSRKAA